MRKDLKEEIYDLEHTYRSYVSKLKADKRITEVNKQHILDFLKDCPGRGADKHRQCIVCQHLRRLGTLTKKDFKAFTKQDTKELMNALETSKWGAWVKYTSKRLFKQMMKEMGKDEEVYKEIRASKPPNNLKKEDLLTADEMRRMVVCAHNNMWKALLSTLFESGARPGEVLNLVIGSVIFNEKHVKIYVSGKMARSSGERPLFLFKTYDLLKAWIEEHPNRKDKSAPLWIGKQGKPLTVSALNVVYKRISRKAKIQKRNFPYLARHSFGTTAFKKYAQPLAMKMMGHRDMSTGQFYIHLSEEDILEALQSENGLEKEKKPELDTDICQECGHQNPYGSIQCNKCKAGLGSAGAIKIEKERDRELEELNELKELLRDPTVIDIIKALKNPVVIDVIKSTMKSHKKDLLINRNRFA